MPRPGGALPFSSSCRCLLVSVFPRASSLCPIPDANLTSGSRIVRRKGPARFACLLRSAIDALLIVTLLSAQRCNHHAVEIPLSAGACTSLISAAHEVGLAAPRPFPAQLLDFLTACSLRSRAAQLIPQFWTTSRLRWAAASAQISCLLWPIHRRLRELAHFCCRYLVRMCIAWSVGSTTLAWGP